MDIDFAILELGKNANFYRHDGTQITYWDPANTDVQPTAAELASVEAAADATKAALILGMTRQKAYPPLGDQLDNLYRDILANKVDATGDFAVAIKAVKDAHPKP